MTRFVASTTNASEQPRRLRFQASARRCRYLMGGDGPSSHTSHASGQSHCARRVCARAQRARRRGAGAPGPSQRLRSPGLEHGRRPAAKLGPSHRAVRPGLPVDRDLGRSGALRWRPDGGARPKVHTVAALAQHRCPAAGWQRGVGGAEARRPAARRGNHSRALDTCRRPAWRQHSGVGTHTGWRRLGLHDRGAGPPAARSTTLRAR